jgi:hypothetical protein
MKIGIGKAGKIMYTKFQEGATPISDLWLKPETIAEDLLPSSQQQRSGDLCHKCKLFL